MSISYPVDVINTRWAFVRASDSTMLKHNRRWPVRNGGPIPGLDPDVVPLLEVRQPQPTYDPDTEKLERIPGVIDIPNNTHTHDWQIVPLTQDELDENTEREQAKQAYQGLMNGAGNQATRLQRVERVAAHLLKLQYGPL